jgi:hypothetical protein
VSSLILIEQQSAEQFFHTVFQPLNAILNEPTKFINHQQEHYLMRRSFLEYTILLSELIESIRTENNKIRQNFFLSIQYLIVNLNRFLPLIVNRDTG